MHYIGWLKVPENVMRRMIVGLSDPIYRLSSQAGQGSNQFATKEELEAAYQDMERRFKEVEVDMVQFELIKKENQQLREQLHFFRTTPYQHVGAVVSRVVGKDIDPMSNTVVVNRGAKDGVAVGNPVIVANGVLVGKIARTEEDISVVRLINDNQSKVAATVMNKEQSIGLVEGGFGISVRLNFIPQNETVQVGDSIVTSGLEDEIPRGLLIGRVESVEKEAYQPFQKAVLSPAANLEKIQDVSIITALE